MNAPATSTRRRFHTFWLTNARGSSDSPSSPVMAQYPPKGTQRREYSVSPFCFWKMAGPIPIANSSTRMPHSFATAKWPNSWIPTRIPKNKTAIMI